MNIIQTIRKYPKDTMKVIAAILIGVLAVSSDGFSDLARKAFWWNFWTIVQILAALTWIIVWVAIKKRQDEQNRR